MAEYGHVELPACIPGHTLEGGRKWNVYGMLVYAVDWVLHPLSSLPYSLPSPSYTSLTSFFPPSLPPSLPSPITLWLKRTPKMTSLKN